MAGNKQRFTYEINADIGQAKKAISDLQQSIDKLSKAQINTNYLDKGINNAVAAAKELEYHLNAALNQNTGKLNLNTFTSSLEQSNVSAKDLMQTLLQGGSAGQQTFASLANAIAQSEVPLRRANKTLQDFATTLKNTVKWEISSTMVHGLESALSGAVSYAKNLNTSLTNIRIVTGQSVDDMARFAKEANAAAKALSTTTKSYADASLIYYQQGDSQELAAKKAAITIKAANSSFETSAKEMSEYLTSVWNSYQVGADELERYVDIMANLGAKTATSLEEIATSMQKVAATANTVGVSMEQVSSIIATVSSVTRESAESIGTSYKTIFARIGDLKLGKVDEDGVGLGQVSSQLDAIGVKILDESGNLREMGSIIMDLGTKWQTMNQAQKTAVAQVVAGKRQYTQLMALFENWDMFNANMNIAENSEGALQKMADTYAESWEAASARVQASMESIYGQVLNDEFIIKLTNGFASITDGISNMISGFGGLSGVLLHTGAIGTKVFQKQIASSIDRAKDSVTTFFSQFKNDSAKDAISKLFHGDIKSVEAIKFAENTNKWKQDLEMASKQAKISSESDIKVRENAETILALKQALLDAENQLSTAQMQRAQQDLAYLSQEQDALVKILRQKEERAKVEKQYAAQARVAISQANPDMSADQYEDLTTQSDKVFGNINKKYEQVGVISNALDGLKSGVYDVDKAFELLNQEIQDPKNKEKLQQMKQEIDALDDSEKITKLEEKLKKFSNTLQQSAAQDLKEFKKALEQAFEGNQDILDKIDRVFDQTVENAREKGEDAGEAYARGLKVGVLRSNFEQLITEKLDPKKLESFGGKVSQVANAALDLSSFVYAAGNAVSILGDESSTAGEKMYALIGIISGVGEAITGLGALAQKFGPGGAIVGAAITLGAAFFTVKDEIEKNQREQYEKEFEVTSSRSSDRVSKVTEEEKELQTLLSTYNDLYQRYKAGEDVQNELSASASALADAYGITGAAVAAVTGNFEAFNDQIATSLDLSSQLKDAKIATNLARNTVNEHQVKDLPTVSFKTELENQQVARALDTSALMAEILENSGNYTIADLLTDVTINKDNNGNLSFAGNDLFNALYQARNADMNLPGQDMLRSLIESTIIDALNNGEAVVDNKGLVNSQQKLMNPWSLFEARYETEYLDIDKTNLEDVIQLAIDNIDLFGGIDANSLLTGAYLDKDTTKLQSVLDAIVGEEESQIATIDELIGDTYASLFDSNTKKLIWDDSASADEKVEAFDLYKKWREELVGKLAGMADGPIKELGESLLSEIDKIVNDPTLGKAVEEYKQARKSEEILKQAEGLIKETVGKNIDDYNLEDYTLLWEKLQSSVDENKETYNLTQYEPDSEEYITARNKVIASIINDYTMLDDWTNVYLSLAEIFTDSEDFKKASIYVKNLKPEEITGDLLEALSLDIGRFRDAGKYTEAVKASQGAKQNKIDAQEYYTKASQVASTYKSGMDLEDATAIYDTFFKEGVQELEGYTKSWDEFLKLDSDARKTYLEGMSEAALKAARDKADTSLTKYTEEQTAFNDQYGAMLTDTSLATLISDFMLDENNQLKYIGKDATQEEAVREALVDKANTYDYEGDINALYQGYQGIVKQSAEIQQNIDSTINELKGYQLLDEVGDRAIDKITRLGNIVSKLPEDSKEFKKLMDQLPGVTEENLINMSELKRAELILNNLDKPLKENFTDETTGEVDWGEYYKALNAWKEANKSAVDTILESADEAFTQIENRMNHAREEAEKTKTIAETLSGAVQTGKLTETQKLGMDANLLKAWNEAADAPARAAIAMQQWNKYANENAIAARELLTTYSKAEGAIFTVEDITSTGALKDSEKGKENFRDMLAQMDLDDEIKSIWEKAWDQAVSKGIKFDGKSDFEIIELLRDEIGEMGELTKEEMDAVTAAVKDNMTQMFQELHDQNIEQARSAADAWLDAFNTINNAKLKLLSGESILEMIAGDPQAILTMAQNTGKTISEIINGAISGSLKASDFKDFNMNEYVNTQMAAAGMFDGFGESILKDMNAQGYQYDREKEVYYNPENNAIVSEKDVLGPIYETMLKAINPTATQNQIQSWLNLIFADSAKYTSLLVEPMNQLTEATVGAGQALNVMSDQKLIEAASDVTQQEAAFRGQKVEYEDLTEVQAAIDRAQQAKYAGESWESLSQEDRDILGKYGIDFSNVDTAANECASALAACAQAALDLMKATAAQEGYTYSEQEKAWGKEITTDVYSDGAITYTEEEGRSAYGTDWDTYKTGLTKGTSTRWIASEEITEQMEKGQEAVDAANGAISDTDYKTLERMAEALGMSVLEFKTYAETINSSENVSERFEKDSKELYQYAFQVQQAAKAFKELQDISKDTWKDLKDSSKKGTAEYIKNISNLRQTMSKLFNTDMKHITKDFVEDHLDELEKMANGTEEEALRAQDAIEDDLLAEIAKADGWEQTVVVNAETGEAENSLTYLQNAFDRWDNEEIDFTVNANTAGAEADVIASLQSMLDSGVMTASGIQEALNAIGWAPQIEWDGPYTSQQVTEMKTTGYVLGLDGSMTPVSATSLSDTEEELWVPRIGSAKKISSPGGGSRKSGNKGGGGGSSPKKETKEKVRGRDEIERYHKQNDTIERLTSQLEEIDKLKERAYGKKHIAQIEAETAALNKQLLAQQDLHDEALKWMAADKADLEKYGAEYDENGTIVNYEKVMERIIDEYNSAIERYNNSGQGEGDKLALEAAEQIFEDAKKAIENYEEALGIANDTANEMLEIQNQMSELEVEKITYELELKMDMNERDLEMLEYYQEKYSEELGNQDKLFNTFIQSAAEYEDNLAQLGKAYEDLSRQYAAGLINEAHYAEAVTELQEEIVDNLNSLQEIQNELAEAYANTLELAREEIEKTTDAIDHSNNALRSFMDITRLTGNDTEYKKLGAFYDQMYNNNLTKINVQKAHLDSLLEEEDRFQEKIRNGQQLTELEKAEYAALSEQIQETRDTLLNSVVESLEVVRESYENTINSIADDLDNFMAGAAGSMAYLQEQYGYFQEEQERYVSTSKELYEVSKLNRDIEGTLATATSSAAKEALKALQEKINKQSELNELTEYDIEMNQLQYQLLLARIKLEEAQNAKDVVRLTRDENGNYAYRYTANQDKIDEAAQHYEDVLQQINDTTVQRTSEIEQQLLNTMANYKEKFQEIATDYSLTEEERLNRLQDLNNQFRETMLYIQEQNTIATNNLTANQEAIAGHYGTTLSDIMSSTAGNVNDTVQSMIDKTQEYIAAMNNAIFGEEGAQSAWQQYIAQIGDIEGSADVAYDNLLGNAEEMGEMNGFAAEEALEVIQTLRDTLDPLEALSSAWDAHNAILEATISNYENLAQVIQGVLSAIGEIPNGGSTNVDGAHRYAKGGLVDYTGLAWVDGTASNPEMMLNPSDTQNILKATTMVKSLDSSFIGSLVESVKSAAAAMLHMFGGAYHAATNVHTTNDSALDQNVHITAEFPNVQNHTEIEEAFDNLINQAAQFAHRKN